MDGQVVEHDELHIDEEVSMIDDKTRRASAVLGARYLSQCVEIRAKSEELVELLNEIVILLLAFWFFHTAGSDSVELRCLPPNQKRER